MPLILPGNVASATASTAYTVANSLRCDTASQTYMHRTPGSTGNRRTWTFSTWFKRSAIGATAPLMFGYHADSSNNINVGFTSTFQLFYRDKKSGTTEIEFKSSAKYRDPSAWMHLVVAVDTTQSTEGNRVKIYINGVQVTAFATETYPDEDYDTLMNVSGYKYEVADVNTDDYWDGYLAETVLIDGSQLAPTSFGEFNSDSPTIWQPIDVSGLTFGTNGFYLDYEASDNLGNAADGGTDFTEVNFAAVDQATDTPTNNFCTLNPIYLNDGGWASQGAPGTFSQGNMNMGTAGHGGTLGTIGTTTMKFYFEVNIENFDNLAFGVIGTGNHTAAVTYDYDDASAYGYYPYGTTGQKIVGGSFSSDSNFKDAGIYHFAVDPTANKMWIGKDGTWDGDPAAGSGNLFTLGAYEFTPWIHAMSSAQTNTFACNFGGCPGFTVSSGNADDDGYGNFEFDVPAGFYALCTKNLAEYG